MTTPIAAKKLPFEAELLIHLHRELGVRLDRNEELIFLTVTRFACVMIERDILTNQTACSFCAEKFLALDIPALSKIGQWYAKRALELNDDVVCTEEPAANSVQRVPPLFLELTRVRYNLMALAGWAILYAGLLGAVIQFLYPSQTGLTMVTGSLVMAGILITINGPCRIITRVRLALQKAPAPDGKPLQRTE